MQYVNWWRASRKDPPYAGWLLFLLTVLVSPHWSVGQIERVFSAASHKKVWDHFTKAQRKNIEMWKKQCAVRTCGAKNVQIWFSVRRCKMEVLVQWLTGWWYMRFEFLIMVSIRVWHCAVTHTGINVGEHVLPAFLGSALNNEAVYFFETSVVTCQTALCHIP